MTKVQSQNPKRRYRGNGPNNGLRNNRRKKLRSVIRRSVHLSNV